MNPDVFEKPFFGAIIIADKLRDAGIDVLKVEPARLSYDGGYFVTDACVWITEQLTIQVGQGYSLMEKQVRYGVFEYGETRTMSCDVINDILAELGKK